MLPLQKSYTHIINPSGKRLCWGRREFNKHEELRSLKSVFPFMFLHLYVFS